MSIVNIMAGRLTGDPESKATQNGNVMANFSLADNHGKDAQGQEKVSFFRCTAFGKQGEMILASCKKGHRLNISGRLETRQYTNNSGQPATSLDVTVHEFGFIEPRDQQQQQTAQPAQGAQQQQTYQQATPFQQPVQAQTAAPAYQYDERGNAYQFVNGQWQMARPAAAAPAPVAPVPGFTPPGYASQQPTQGALPFGNPPGQQRPY